RGGTGESGDRAWGDKDKSNGFGGGSSSDEDFKLSVTVYSHRVVGEGYGAHTEYTLLAQASVLHCARRELEVGRRFSDFEWLHMCFQSLPGVLPPPLPPKRWVRSGSRDFKAERMKGLQRYINRVAQHPVLRRQYALQVFLEGTAQGLKAAKALLPWTPSGGYATLPASPCSHSLSCSPSDDYPSVLRLGPAGGGSGGGAGSCSGGWGGAGGDYGRGRERRLSLGSSDKSCSNGWFPSVTLTSWFNSYGGYMASSVTSIIGILGAVKTKAKAAVGMGASAAPIAVEADPDFEAQVARIDELMRPLTGVVRAVQAEAGLKRGHAYEMSRLGHYLTQVLCLHHTGSLPQG
ncbi:unnamed protein product, partial [Choristocarpus tenellus]